MSAEINNQTLEKQVLSSIFYAKHNSNFYRQTLKHVEFSAQNFTVEEIKKLPFTTKEDISKCNSDFLAVPIADVADYSTTSGTSGEPITIYLTKNDLQRLARNERHSLALTGATSNDVFQLMTTIDKQFMAGLAYFLGVQELGAGIIRIGPGVPALQWNSILLNKPTVLIAVPSFIINLLDYATNNNIEFSRTAVKSIVCIGESIRNEDLTLNVLGKRITQQWDVELFSTYASTEMGAAFTECFAHAGCHLNNELLYLEVIDEDGLEVKSGEQGEIVITTLGTEGTPLIRYKTGDIATVYKEKCQCGITSPRLGPIIGRKNQMIKYKGTTIFPKAIFELLDAIPAISCYKVEISKDYLENDNITLLLEKKIEGTPTVGLLIDECKSKLRAVPHFVFLESDYLRNQVYKNHSRKPEKIVFK
jgi:phenylacetate-CoA ligase